MRKPLIIETGEKFGKLAVVGFNDKKSTRYRYWDCICDCGKKVSVVGNSLRRGRSTSCGCSHGNARKKPVTYIVNDNGCWICNSHYKDADGYPHICINYKHKTVCRLYYEKYRGSVPDGMVICHTCDTPSCINPDHLFLGTNFDNVKDRVSKFRSSSKFTKNQIIDIRNSTDKQIEIARKYGVKRGAIYCIQSRKTWKHVL
jgi:hypothetical protein